MNYLKYKLEDKISNNNSVKKYLNECMTMFEFKNNIKHGDKFWKLLSGKVQEVEFVKFVSCPWRDGTPPCNICKGYILTTNGNKLCSGVEENNSNILKIIKYSYLEDELFEI